MFAPKSHSLYQRGGIFCGALDAHSYTYSHATAHSDGDAMTALRIALAPALPTQTPPDAEHQSPLSHPAGEGPGGEGRRQRMRRPCMAYYTPNPDGAGGRR